MSKMDPLRWKYELNVNVDETGKQAKSEGFLVRILEGQSKTNEEPYPLNQVEIKGWDLSSRVKVIVGPRVTQIYFYIENVPEISEIEKLL